jgi:hypothetical protein
MHVRIIIQLEKNIEELGKDRARKMIGLQRKLLKIKVEMPGYNNRSIISQVQWFNTKVFLQA